MEIKFEILLPCVVIAAWMLWFAITVCKVDNITTKIDNAITKKDLSEMEDRICEHLERVIDTRK